jgi:hypothetical protein
VSKESRQNERFDAEEGATAAIVTPDEKDLYAGVGEIIDISMGGLSLQYDAKTGDYKGFVDLEIEIFGYSNRHMRMYVGRLPCKVIYEKVVTTDEQRAIDTRQLGLRFENVPYFKLHKLGNFVEIFTNLRDRNKEPEEKTDLKDRKKEAGEKTEE